MLIKNTLTIYRTLINKVGNLRLYYVYITWPTWLTSSNALTLIWRREIYEYCKICTCIIIYKPILPLHCLLIVVNADVLWFKWLIFWELWLGVNLGQLSFRISLLRKSVVNNINSNSIFLPLQFAHSSFHILKQTINYVCDYVTKKL